MVKKGIPKLFFLYLQNLFVARGFKFAPGYANHTDTETSVEKGVREPLVCSIMITLKLFFSGWGKQAFT